MGTPGSRINWDRIAQEHGYPVCGKASEIYIGADIFFPAESPSGKVRGVSLTVDGLQKDKIRTDITIKIKSQNVTHTFDGKDLVWFKEKPHTRVDI